MKKISKLKGFTLIELLIVVAIIGLLSGIIFIAVNKARENAYMAAAQKEIFSIATAIEFYMDDYGDYPPDVNRDIPPGLEEYLGPGAWPKAPWPGSVYDWDVWDDPDNPGEKIYQISIRFCEIDQPSTCRFPDKPWAEDFDIVSSVYYCISGACRAHGSYPADHPGYCINCGQSE